MAQTASYWIDKLNLQAHPEGGHFKETYRSMEEIAKEGLPRRFFGNRNFSTAIMYLLSGHEISKFHRIKSDEIWHFYAGTGLTIHQLDENCKYTQIKLGNDPSKNQHFQYVVPPGVWFGATVDNPENPNSFGLAGCTVAPGFDYLDFELADRSQLLEHFPAHSEIIRKLT
ncbi:MAG: cupin domain-containing protein [Balneolales bacterium]